MSSNVFVGVDGTSLSTKCVVLDVDGVVVGEAEGEGTNWKAGVTKSKVVENLWAVMDKALAAAQRTRDDINVVVACMEAVDKDRDKDLVSGWISGGIPEGGCVIVYPHAAGSLAAALDGSLDGVVLVCGAATMIALGFTDSGEEVRAGGLMRDQGSGFSIGTNCLAAAVRSFDGRGATTSLLASLIAHLDLEDGDDLVDWANADQSTAAISGLCSICFECDDAGDAVASEIVQDAAKHLAGVIELVVSKCGRSTVVLDGSVARHPRIQSRVVEAVSASLPNVRCVVPTRNPAHGAALVARNSTANKHHAVLDKVIQDTTDQIPKLNQALKSMDKIAEEIELQAIVAAAEVRLAVDTYVIALERRMMKLLSQVTTLKQRQLSVVNQHRQALRKLVQEASASTAYLSQVASTVSASDIASITEFADEQLMRMREAKLAAADFEVDGFRFVDDKTLLEAVSQIGALQCDSDADINGVNDTSQNEIGKALPVPTTAVVQPTITAVSISSVSLPTKAIPQLSSGGRGGGAPPSHPIPQTPARNSSDILENSSDTNATATTTTTITPTVQVVPSKPMPIIVPVPVTVTTAVPVSHIQLTPRTAKVHQQHTVKVVSATARHSKSSDDNEVSSSASAPSTPTRPVAVLSTPTKTAATKVQTPPTPTIPTPSIPTPSIPAPNAAPSKPQVLPPTPTSPTMPIPALLGGFMREPGHNHRSRVNSCRDYRSITGITNEFGQDGSGDGCFNGPCCLDVSPVTGHIFVADRDNHRIQVFAMSGQFVRHFGTKGSAEGQFSQPQGVVVTRDAHVVVADKNNHRVQIFTEEGVFVRAFGSEGRSRGQFQGPVGVATHPDTSDIFVADCLNHRVQVFSFAGDFKCEFGSQGSKVGQFMFPLGIAVTPEGHVVVVDSTNHRVQILTAKGSHVATLKPTGSNKSKRDVLSSACTLQFPVDVAVDSYGNIIVTDKEFVQVFASDQTFLVGLRPGGSGNGLRCVGVNRETCTVVLADNGRNRIQII